MCRIRILLTTTDPTDSDTDEGGATDGEEDANANGAIDSGECDPNLTSDDVGCIPADTDGDGLRMRKRQ